MSREAFGETEELSWWTKMEGRCRPSESATALLAERVDDVHVSAATAFARLQRPFMVTTCVKGAHFRSDAELRVSSTVALCAHGAATFRYRRS
jgi:hypothetical protein